jgi:acetyl-CoA carboxylase carboxyl transferase subunit beta
MNDNMAWFRREEKYSTVKAPAKRLNIPEGFWVKCDHCGYIGAKKDFETNLKVCSSCDHHATLSALERIDLLFDEGSFTETDANMVSGDPLKFTDKKSYKDRIKAYQAKTGLKDAVRTGTAKLNGMDISVAVMDFGFVGGSMGSVVGEKVTRAIELALDRRIPLVVVSQSGGARMQEGTLSLMQMAKTSAALARLGQARIPYISILTHPTTAGVMASYASLGDVIISEPNALIGFAGPRVIEQTINQILPKGFQRSEFVRDHGFIDVVCHRSEMRQKLINIVSVLGNHLTDSVDELEKVMDEPTPKAAKTTARKANSRSSRPAAKRTAAAKPRTRSRSRAKSTSTKK